MDIDDLNLKLPEPRPHIASNRIVFLSGNIVTSIGFGAIASEAGTIQIDLFPSASQHPRAPTHRIYRQDANGLNIEIGGLWLSQNQKGAPKRTLTINSPAMKANVIPTAHLSTWAVVPW